MRHRGCLAGYCREYACVKAILEESESIVGIHVTAGTVAYECVLEATVRNPVIVDGASTHQFTTLALIEQDVAATKAIRFTVAVVEIHLQNICVIKESIEDVRYPQIRLW